MKTPEIQEIADYRKQLGMPKYQWIPGETGTVAVAEIKGNKFYGHNTTLERKYLGIDNRALRETALKELQSVGELTAFQYGNWNVRFLTHAETEILITAKTYFGNLEGEKVTLFVDRSTCDNCFEHLPKLAAFYELEELKLIDAKGKVVTFNKGT